MPSLSVNGRIAEDALAAEDLAPDHPVERAAVEEFVGALRHHAGGVDVLGLLAALFLLLQPLLDPVLEVLDRVAADAELDEMQWHGDALACRLPGRSSGRFRDCARDRLAPSGDLDRQDARLRRSARRLRATISRPSVDRRQSARAPSSSPRPRRRAGPSCTLAPCSTRSASTLPCIGALHDAVAVEVIDIDRVEALAARRWRCTAAAAAQ